MSEVPKFSAAARHGAEKRFPDGTMDWFESRDFTIDFSEVTLLEQIAKGSYGTVYKGSIGNDLVAIKIEDFHEGDEEQVNLLVELTMLQSFPHDRIVKFIGAGHMNKPGSGQKIMMALELCKNGALRECLKYGLSWPLKVRICLDIVRGLAFLHEQNIIHRDIKTTNVLIDDQWRAKLCDFSFVCHDSSQSKEDYIYGTDEFMSPEVALAMVFGLPADIFSFGIVLCEVVTEKEPSSFFLCRKPQNMFALDANELRASLLPDCPFVLEALALQCCQDSPEGRPTAQVCVEELEALLEDLGGSEGDFVPSCLRGEVDPYANNESFLASTSPMREGHVQQPGEAKKPQSSNDRGSLLDAGSGAESDRARFSYLETLVQELRAENKRLSREVHAVATLMAERSNLSERQSPLSARKDVSRIPRLSGRHSMGPMDHVQSPPRKIKPSLQLNNEATGDQKIVPSRNQEGRELSEASLVQQLLRRVEELEKAASNAASSSDSLLSQRHHRLEERLQTLESVTHLLYQHLSPEVEEVVSSNGEASDSVSWVSNGDAAKDPMDQTNSSGDLAKALDLYIDVVNKTSSVNTVASDTNFVDRTKKDRDSSRLSLPVSPSPLSTSSNSSYRQHALLRVYSDKAALNQPQTQLKSHIGRRVTIGSVPGIVLPFSPATASRRRSASPPWSTLTWHSRHSLGGEDLNTPDTSASAGAATSESSRSQKGARTLSPFRGESSNVRTALFNTLSKNKDALSRAEDILKT